MDSLPPRTLSWQGFFQVSQRSLRALRFKKGRHFDTNTLGACNPPLAHQALNTELEIGLLLPCNVVVYEEDGGSVVSIVDPISMLGVVENPELQPVASEARSRLERVIEALND